MNTGNQNTKLELSYLTKQLCIIMKMSRHQSVEIDANLLQNLSVRIKRKLDQETSAGRIEKYMFSTDTLIRAWPLLKKKLSELESSDEIAIRIAFGVKNFDQVRISSPDFEDSYCTLTIDATAEEILQWNIVALSSYVKDFVQNKGWSSGVPDRRSLREACNTAIENPGESIQIRKIEESDDLEVIKIGSKSKSSNASIDSDSSESIAENYNGKGLLKLKLEAGGLEARITNFNARWYEIPELKFNETWLKNELRRLGIKDITKEFIQRINQKMERRQDLNGLQVANGIAPIPGRSPYLVACKNSSASSLIPCEMGETIAEVRYKIAAVPGTDVYGKLITPPVGEYLEVEIGEGIERVDSTRFKATQTGLLKISDKHLSVLKTYVCEGDFNANTNIVDFKGNIIITGNVETGATLCASGDILVEGSVRGASVFCGGNLTVKGGLSTSEHAIIRCDGSMKVGFIERAKIYCKGNIEVESAILQSEIYCGGDICVASSDGRVGASRLYMWGNLTVAKLGFATGSPSYIHLGEDWKEAIRVNIYAMRLQRLSEVLEKDLREERTIKKMKASQLNKKRLEQKLRLERHIHRLELIARTLEQKLSDLRSMRRFNPSAKLKITHMTEGDVEVQLAGAPYNVARVA